MSGKRYKVFMAPSAHRRYKKFDILLKQKVIEEANKTSEDPYRYEELKGPLRGIRYDQDLPPVLIGSKGDEAFT